MDTRNYGYQIPQREQLTQAEVDKRFAELGYQYPELTNNALELADSSEQSLDYEATPDTRSSAMGRGALDISRAGAVEVPATPEALSPVAEAQQVSLLITELRKAELSRNDFDLAV